MLTFAGLAFLCLPGWRYLAARALSYGIGQGLVGGRRVVTLGEAAELERLSPSDFLQFGIDDRIEQCAELPAESRAVDRATHATDRHHRVGQRVTVAAHHGE